MSHAHSTRPRRESNPVPFRSAPTDGLSLLTEPGQVLEFPGPASPEAIEPGMAMMMISRLADADPDYYRLVSISLFYAWKAAGRP